MDCDVVPAGNAGLGRAARHAIQVTARGAARVRGALDPPGGAVPRDGQCEGGRGGPRVPNGSAVLSRVAREGSIYSIAALTRQDGFGDASCRGTQLPLPPGPVRAEYLIRVPLKGASTPCRA